MAGSTRGSTTTASPASAMIAGHPVLPRPVRLDRTRRQCSTEQRSHQPLREFGQWISVGVATQVQLGQQGIAGFDVSRVDLGDARQVGHLAEPRTLERIVVLRAGCSRGDGMSPPAVVGRS